MTASFPARPGRPCPPWCVGRHEGRNPSHFGEQRAIHPGSVYNLIAAMAVRDDSRLGDRKSFVMLHGSLVGEASALAEVPVRDAEDLAAIVGMLADATPEQHREIAAAIRHAAADIAGTRP
jgi:hypothetical protein